MRVSLFVYCSMGAVIYLQLIQRLQQQLQEELQFHATLEKAIEENAVELSSASSLSHHAQELLSNIAILESAVSRLEQEFISLNFQVSQERNERRLAEYRFRHSSQSLSACSDILEAPRAIKMDSNCCQPLDFEKLTVVVKPKGLWDNPNHLSEEMVRCMKNIFISLADSGRSLTSSPSEIQSPSLSPRGHLSISSMWSLSERSMMSSWVQSSQLDLKYNPEVLATENTSDPYRVRGKLSWADIGSYGLATEVSWMSVGKKQMEYAAGALRNFRMLVEQLAKVNPVHLSCNEKLAFWINIYNALIMHAYLAYGVPRSDLKLFSLMQKAAYTIGGHSFSAAAIEHVVLKMKPPAHRPQIALLLALHKLKVSEEQRKSAIDSAEPLVAFALSNGMHSSPAVRIYTANTVREQLQEAQRDYIRASVGLSSTGRLLVPKMLHCFAKGMIDSDANLGVWISQYLPPHQAAFVEHCMSKRRHSHSLLISSRNCGILPFDTRFRYLFLPEQMI
ncbi:uncharacterized protein LOC127794574 isoform X3 [Diospyros lotus]|uniref:uncharacterized protein LOC127794574 isoform X3 n=1 Tax=Diospyros lotus TaxID=55363 RepID=UPI00225ADE78|nr:uncharacterized protein LOC127794574 isoform X3 [Diospyros lotus]